MNLLNEYQNGNYQVEIYDDGTKIRETEDDKFVPSFPECMDVKITDYCDMGCPFCHENSTKNGLHGDILNAKFIDTLMPYTEIAIGGGNPLSHPDLLEFLMALKNKNIIANITVNQKHFLESIDVLKEWSDESLIYGLGISLTNPTEQFVDLAKNFPNAVTHIINGIITTENLQKMYDKNLKLLILGYKEFRRGKDYYSEEVENNKNNMYNMLPNILNKFQVVSFDNLAIKQLNARRLLSEKKWNEFYMGDDGQYTMYIDLVKNKFARSSVSTNRYDLIDNIVDMFDVVRNEKSA
jgi:MoaA/NifB/PqqE/SkfB family radical SAM enzyme